MLRRLLVPLLLLFVGCSAKGSLTIDIAALTEPVRVELFVLELDRAEDGEGLCSDLISGSVDVEAQPFVVRRSIAFGIGDPAPAIGLLPEGRALFFARARDARCEVVGAGCIIEELEERRSVEVSITLEPLAVPLTCPSELACVQGECRPCLDEEECDDGDLCTADRCAEARCVTTPIDGCTACERDDECDDDDLCTHDVCDDGVCASWSEPTLDEDADGHSPVACGGDDCDDADPAVHNGAERRCGRAVDHDCDGTIDDSQGCEPCSPSATASPILFATLDVDARQGLYVVGSEPTDEMGLREVYAVSSSEIQVVTIGTEGVVEARGVTSHGVRDPLPPVVVGEHLILLERSDPFGLRVFSREELISGEASVLFATDEPPWGRPYSVLVGDGVLYISTRPNSLWSLDLARLPEIELGERAILEGLDSWRNCTDMIRGGDYILGIEPLMSESTLSVAEITSPGVARGFKQFHISLGEPTDIELFTGADGRVRFGMAERLIGLSLIDLESVHLDEDEWDRDYEEELPYVEFPEVGCFDTSSCQWPTKVSSFGPDTALVLTRDDHLIEPGTLRLYMADLSDPSAPVAGAWVEVSEPAPVPGREEHIFVSGSLAFVGTTPLDSSSVVKVYSIDCGR